MAEIRAPHGTTLTARSWQTEAPLRMLQNNLDPEVAEHPEQLVVYGGTGKAARDWPSYHAIIRTLTDLQQDETLLVQSGRPVGVMRTHEWAPRVLIANSNLVGDWANWEEFRRLEALGLIMYGQMTAGSWIYIGTQGILQGTYETFAAVAAKRFNGTLAGTITLTAGLGGMGGAQPLAVTMNDGVAICIDVDQSRITRRIEHRYLDVQADSDRRRAAPRRRGARRAQAAVDRPARQRRVARPAAAGQRRADRHRHRPDVGARSAVLPADRRRVRRLARLRREASRRSSPDGPARRWRATSRRWSASRTRAPRSSTTATRSAARRKLAGYSRAFDFPGFVPAYIRPLFCEGKGPFRWAALSGDPKDIARTDKAILDLFPENESLARWITMAQERVHFQGLPARICWLGYGERDRAGLEFNKLVADRRDQRADRDRTRPPRLRVGRLALTAKRNRWPTGRTRSPTGRCSTRWSTWPAARRGCRSTTAAASAWAARSTPARCRSPTARSWRRRSSSGC